MSSFTDNLIVEKIAPNLWRTYRAFTYYTEDLTMFITVPEGFITDFASVPRAFWMVFPPDGLYTQSAVLHDFLYNTKILSRLQSDRIFLEAMKVLKVPKFTRTMMYLAVHWFGKSSWNKKG